MSLNAAGLQAWNEDGNDGVWWVGIGSSTTSGSQTSAARVQVTWGTPTNASPSVVSATNVPMAFTGTAAAGATNALFFSASTAGTFYGNQALTGDQAFNAAGNYQISALTFSLS